MSISEIQQFLEKLLYIVLEEWKIWIPVVLFVLVLVLFYYGAFMRIDLFEEKFGPQ
jgi:hypothetical protein